MPRITPLGKCRWCGTVLSKAAVGRHLAACAKSRRGATPLARNATRRRWLHVAFEGADDPDYWLHLAVPAKDPLWHLDNVLRDIWLECCGHMSAFRIDGQYFTESPWSAADAMEDGEDMSVAAGEALQAGDRFEYKYDFGSTTRLAGRVLTDLPDVFPKRSVQLLARNDRPTFRCLVCGKAATRICLECAGRGPGTLCDGCVKTHDCDRGMLLPVINSPRVGVCAYGGPSKEP